MSTGWVSGLVDLFVFKETCSLVGLHIIPDLMLWSAPSMASLGEGNVRLSFLVFPYQFPCPTPMFCSLSLSEKSILLNRTWFVFPLLPN